MAKPSALKLGLKTLAQPEAAPAAPVAVSSPAEVAPAKKPEKQETVLIGGHFPPEVRRALLLVQANPKNEGKNVKDLLGEAINDLCGKYGVPEPARIR